MALTDPITIPDGCGCCGCDCNLCSNPDFICVRLTGLVGTYTRSGTTYSLDADGNYTLQHVATGTTCVINNWYCVLPNYGSFSPATDGGSAAVVGINCLRPSLNVRIDTLGYADDNNDAGLMITAAQVADLCAGGQITVPLYRGTSHIGDSDTFPATISAVVSLGPCPAYGFAPVMMAAYAPPLVAPDAPAGPAVRIAVAAPALRRVAPAVAGRVLGGLPMVAACRHEGPVISPCLACGDKDANHVRACAQRGECTRSGADATRAGCQVCPEYDAGG